MTKPRSSNSRRRSRLLLALFPEEEMGYETGDMTAVSAHIQFALSTVICLYVMLHGVLTFPCVITCRKSSE